MADEQHITLKQFEDFARLADERLDKLELGKANKASSVSISIPTSGWALLNEDLGDEPEGDVEVDRDDGLSTYPYYIDIPVEGVTAVDRASVTLAPGSYRTAVACGLCPTNETIQGAIRLRAASVPETAMEAEYWIENGKE